MRAFTIALLLLAMGCSNEVWRPPHTILSPAHGTITESGTEFKVVLLEDGRVEVHTSDGNRWNLLEGAIELSNGKGTLFVRKVRP